MVEKAKEYRDLFDRLTSSSLQVLIALIIALGLWITFYLKQYEGITVIDTLDIAQEARNLSLGRGLTTNFIKPLSILIQENDFGLPDLYNSPLYVIVLSALFRILGFTDAVVVGSSLIWAFLSGILLLIFTRQFFGLLVSLLVFLLYAANLGVIECAFSGLHLSFLSFLILLFCLLFFFRKRSSLFWTAVLGFFAGLLYLAEFDFLFLSLPIALLVVLDSREKKGFHALIFLVCWLISASPWLIRNAVVSGSPVFSLRWFDFKTYTDLFPGNKIMRNFDPNMPSASFPFPIFYRKLLMFVRLSYPYWVSLSHSFIMPFFFVSILLRFEDRRWERLKRLILLLFFAELVLIAAGNGDIARILIFMPVVILSGMIAFKFLLLKMGSGRGAVYWIIIGIFFLVNFYPGISGIIFGFPLQKYVSPIFTGAEAESIKKGENLEKLAGLVKSDEVVVSDVPWAVAWYANRSSIWLPWKVGQMRLLKEKFKNIRFLHLTPILFKYPPAENTESWQSIYRSGMVPEWLQVDRGLLLSGEELIMGDIIFERLDLE